MLFTPPQMPPSNPIVTVWVHGTKSNVRPFTYIANRVANLIFQRTPGFHLSTELGKYHYESIRATILGTLAPTIFQKQYAYSFGWSGELNVPARKNASQELFNHLKLLHYQILEKTGLAPEFVIMAHSHGGNVVLHLAEIQDPDGFELSVSKAILLACPVQEITAHLINSPVFKRIYSLHSHTDMIQVIDMQGIHKKRHERKHLFSQRHFGSHPKLAQAQIRWKNGPTWHQDDRVINEILLKNLNNGIKIISLLKKNRGLLHVEFILLPFLRHLPTIIAQLDDLFEKGGHCPSHKDHDIVIEL